MKLLTLDEYNALSPKSKGYAHYIQQCWPESKIPEAPPYAEGTSERRDFAEGSFLAMQECVECGD